jgi:hypothetical protein
LHSQPPGVHGCDTQAPAVDREPPLFDSVWHPIKNRKISMLLEWGGGTKKGVLRAVGIMT